MTKQEIADVLEKYHGAMMVAAEAAAADAQGEPKYEVYDEDGKALPTLDRLANEVRNS